MVLSYTNLAHSTHHHANITIIAATAAMASTFYSNILDMDTTNPSNHHNADFVYRYSYFPQNY